jgi:hypothetical protein
MSRATLGLLALTGALLGPAAQTQASADFSDFQTQFRAALALQDAAAVGALTRLPFQFEGRAHDAKGFVRQVWPRLFSAAVRRCLQQAQALSEGPHERVLLCRPYSFHFDASGGAWRLREFAVDGEDAP